MLCYWLISLVGLRVRQRAPQNDKHCMTQGSGDLGSDVAGKIWQSAAAKPIAQWAVSGYGWHAADQC